MLMYNTLNANKKIDNFFLLYKKIATLVSLNKDFDIFMSSKINYNNFDLIQNNIYAISTNVNEIENNELFKQLDTPLLKQSFFTIQKDLEKKVELVNRVVSKSAVLNNSYRYIQKLNNDIDNKKLLHIYNSIIGLDYNPEIELDSLNKDVNTFKTSNKAEEIFIAHAKIILLYYSEFNKLKEASLFLGLAEKLNLYEENFASYSNYIINSLQNVVWFLMTILFFALLAFLYYIHLLTLKKTELIRFKKAVQNSDNIVVITDKEYKIKYVNKSFEKVTGYTKNEVLGNTPSMLKSYQQPNSFYEELKKTISSGQQWQGEFINKNKDGRISFEKASITPILNEKGEVTEYLAIKLDITKEKKTQELLKEKEHILSQQSKMIAMREMLESIAHQWRQPLSTISTAASGLKLNKEFDTLNDEKFAEFVDVIMDNTLGLSTTIDNFKNYFNTKNEKTIFDIGKTVQKMLDLIGYRLYDDKIEVIRDISEIKLEGLENELMQSLVNILNNSQEAFHKNSIDKKYIFIDAYEKDKNIFLSIKDNAGGIPKDILEHVFEPYFTTKHQSNGTGIGLYMTYEIIVKHFMGSIGIKNVNYKYKGEKQKGIKIDIQIPQSLHNIDVIHD